MELEGTITKKEPNDFSTSYKATIYQIQNTNMKHHVLQIIYTSEC